MPPVNAWECNNQEECGAIRRLEEDEEMPTGCENCGGMDITPLYIQRLGE